jgi:hypothetical protein
MTDIQNSLQSSHNLDSSVILAGDIGPDLALSASADGLIGTDVMDIFNSFVPDLDPVFYQSLPGDIF